MAKQIETDDRLKEWFDLLLEFRDQGLTPEQVRAAVAEKNPVVKEKTTAEILRDFENGPPNPANSSWCW